MKLKSLGLFFYCDRKTLKDLNKKEQGTPL